MLVLTRKLGETLYIGDDIQIVYISKAGGRRQIKLGIQAPPHIKILREEAIFRFSKKDDPELKVINQGLLINHSQQEQKIERTRQQNE